MPHPACFYSNFVPLIVLEWPSNVPFGPVTAKIKKDRRTGKPVDRKQKADLIKMVNHLLRRYQSLVRGKLEFHGVTRG